MKKTHLELSMKSLVIVRTTVWSISFSPTPLDEQEPLNNLVSKQETGPTTLLETRIADESPPTELNPNVHPYEPPTANNLHQLEQTQPNVTNTNAAQLSTSDEESPSIL